MMSIRYFPLELEVSNGIGVIRQKVGDLDEEFVEIKISKDQAIDIADFLTKSFKIKKSQMVRGSEAGFDKFWDTYPRKEVKDAALKIWKEKNLGDMVDRIISHVEYCKRSEQWQTPSFIPHATTYLNQRRFLDDLNGARVDPFADVL